MNDKKGPAAAWACAVLVALLSLLVAASAARTVHAQTPPINVPSEQNGDNCLALSVSAAA